VARQDDVPAHNLNPVGANMDVRNLPLPTSSASNPFAKLNSLTSAPGLSGWDAALNQAVESRAGAAPDAGINGAMQTFAQFAARHTNLNTALKRMPKADAFAAEQAEPDAPSPEDAALEQTAQTVVNQFFMGTMLKQMRESPFKNEMFSGGKAGNAYASMFDTHLSENAGSGMARDLVQSMVKAYRKQSLRSEAETGLAVPPA